MQVIADLYASSRCREYATWRKLGGKIFHHGATARQSRKLSAISCQRSALRLWLVWLSGTASAESSRSARKRRFSSTEKLINLGSGGSDSSGPSLLVVLRSQRGRRTRRNPKPWSFWRAPLTRLRRSRWIRRLRRQLAFGDQRLALLRLRRQPGAVTGVTGSGASSQWRAGPVMVPGSCGPPLWAVSALLAIAS